MATALRDIRHPAKEDIELADLLGAVGDPIRLALIRLLDERGELACGQISDALGLPVSTCSYHLRLLREAGAVRTRPSGTTRHMTLRRDDLEDRFPGLVAVLTG
jgi:DNA-binding transcriptional ArsR family regulator